MLRFPETAHAVEQRGSAGSSKDKRGEVQVSCCVIFQLQSEQAVSTGTPALASCYAHSTLKVSVENIVQEHRGRHPARNLFSLMGWQTTFRTNEPAPSLSAYRTDSFLMQVSFISSRHSKDHLVISLRLSFIECVWG